MTSAADHLVRAETLLRQRSLSDARTTYNEAERLGADADTCSGGRWQIAMLLGDFEAAWRETDTIRQRNQPDPNRLWSGERLTGKRVMLRCLHGFGDAVQFLRYLPQLQAAAAQVILEAPPHFKEIASCFRGVGDVITWGADAPTRTPEWDVQIEVMELPYLFRTTVQDLPITAHYITVPELKEARASQKLQVGLAWTSGEWNPSRNLPVEGLAQVLEIRGCQFWSLQSNKNENGQGAMGRLARDAAAASSLVGLARRIGWLDLVITVDSLAAHLAGAMDVPAWLLLQHAADWRWQHLRTDSPWYESMRLFRQPAPQTWDFVLAEVRQALLQRISARGEQ